MSTVTYSPSLGDFLQAIAPGKISRDPFGFISGYRSYVIYTRLDSKSDNELAALGLTRSEIPRIAVEAIQSSKA